VDFWNTKTFWGTGTPRKTTNHHVRFSWLFFETPGQARRLAERRAVVFRGVLEHQNALENRNATKDHEPSPRSQHGQAQNGRSLQKRKKATLSFAAEKTFL
jgi:hypothetical protein